MTIGVHIERIVLDGVTLTQADRARLRDALQAQLAARLTRDGSLEALRANHGAATLHGGTRPGEANGPGGAGGPGESARAAGHAGAGRMHDATGTGAGASGSSGVLRMPAEATPAQWGRGIADALHGALTNGAADGARHERAVGGAAGLHRTPSFRAIEDDIAGASRRRTEAVGGRDGRAGTSHANGPRSSGHSRGAIDPGRDARGISGGRVGGGAR